MNQLQRQYRYWAFISYSHRDAAVGRWLHRSLESYQVPREIQGLPSRDGTVPKRLFPIFRDREEIPTSSDLGSVIRSALAESRYLVVICSPRAAASRWVSQEIQDFKALHGEDRILALIVGGEPNASDRPETAAQECFPEALRYRLEADGTMQRTEVIAADIRPGHDRRRVALLRVIAGLLGVYYDALYQRDRRQRLQRALLGGLAAIVILAVITSLLVVAARKNTLAKENAARAQDSDRRKHLQEYVDDIQNMPANWENNRVDLVRAALERYVAKPPEEDLRGFEWYYWHRMAHSEIATLETHGRILSLDLSSDGKSIWYVTMDGSLESWNVTTGEQKEIRPKSFGARFVAASPKENHFAVTTESRSRKSTVEILDATGASKGKVSARTFPFTVVAFSPDGSQIVTGNMAQQVELWNASNGSKLDQIIELTNNAHSRRNPLSPTQFLDLPNGEVTSVTFSSHGDLIAAGDVNGGITVWDKQGQCQGQKWGGGSSGGLSGTVANAVSSVRYSRGGSKLITRSEKSGILVWNNLKDPPYKLPAGPEAPVRAPDNLPVLSSALSAEFIREDSMIVASSGNILKISPVSGIGAADVRKGHPEAIVTSRVASNGSLAASADLSGQIAVWDLEVAPCGNSEQTFREPVRGLAVDPHKKRSAVLIDRITDFGAAALTKHVALVSDGKDIPVEKADGGYFGLTSSNDGKYLASVAGDAAIVWDFQTGKIVCSVPIPKSKSPTMNGVSFLSNRTAAFQPDGSLFVVGGDNCYTIGIPDKKVTPVAGVPIGPMPQVVWGAPAALMRPNFSFSDKSVMSVAFSPAGGTVALGYGNGDILVARADNWQEIHTLRGHRRGITGLRFSQDGRRLISSAGRFAPPGALEPRDDAGEIKIWNLDSWQLALTLTAPNGLEFSGIALSDEDRKLTASGNPSNIGPATPISGQIFVWDTRPASIADAPQPQRGQTASTSMENRVLIWRAHMAFDGFTSGINAFAIHPSGVFIAGSDVGGTIGIWNTRTGETVRMATFEGNHYSLRFLGDGSVLYAVPRGGGHPIFLTFPDLALTQKPDSATSLPDLRELMNEERPGTPIAFPDGEYIATQTGQTQIKIERRKAAPEGNQPQSTPQPTPPQLTAQATPRPTPPQFTAQATPRPAPPQFTLPSTPAAVSAASAARPPVSAPRPPAAPAVSPLVTLSNTPPRPLPTPAPSLPRAPVVSPKVDPALAETTRILTTFMWNVNYKGETRPGRFESNGTFRNPLGRHGRFHWELTDPNTVKLAGPQGGQFILKLDASLTHFTLTEKSEIFSIALDGGARGEPIPPSVDVKGGSGPP